MTKLERLSRWGGFPVKHMNDSLNDVDGYSLETSAIFSLLVLLKSLRYVRALQGYVEYIISTIANVHFYI